MKKLSHDSVRALGLSLDDLERIRDDAARRGLRDPLKAFRHHRYAAASRGIAFELTFAQWWGLWEPHYHLRGTRSGQMVMARRGDVGPYAIGNVSIKTSRANHREAHGYDDHEIARTLRTFKGMRGSGSAVVQSRVVERFKSAEHYDEDGEPVEDNGGPKNILTSSVYD
ncbi:hypothetical protein [Burkholderia vietnamiensis]|uniref:hypothetical protein n=1 Tax=Burkholderia vietnamiensis TaxID=60552 RepID=UPI001CF104FC|nr:hypothetical protein [Burkholderia vietnamiensis]MCA8264813.1 hypothetical protein [Burkholderia vietnamiensis]HDR8927874.1 hypothetical protein [Burkholderia vietnamiensis]